MTPEELQILEALEKGSLHIGDLKEEAALALRDDGFVENTYPIYHVTLTRAGREVLALRRKLAEVEKDLDIAQSGKVFYHGEWDRKTTQLRECEAERDQLRAILEATS